MRSPNQSALLFLTGRRAGKNTASENALILLSIAEPVHLSTQGPWYWRWINSQSGECSFEFSQQANPPS